MRLGLDARTIYAPQRRGMGRSLLHLYQTLAQFRADLQIIAYHREENPDESLLPGATLKRIDMPGDRFDAWLKWRLPMAAKMDRLDVLHCPANHCPAWMPVPTIVTLHDLIPLDLPHTLCEQQVKRFRQSLDRAVRSATTIACPSQYTKQRLIDSLGVASHRLHVTHWGGNETRTLAPFDQVDKRFNIHSHYVLHFGSGEARKNTARVIDAWAMMRQNIRRKVKLVVLGLCDDSQTRFAAQCKNLGIEKSVSLNGFASDEEAAALMQGAAVLAYPSLSEGFGLPVLEAFASKTAVVTSDRTSLPEVVGDAGLTVDPTDTVAISHAMSRLLRDRGLRQVMSGRGLARLQQFTWQNCAESFMAALEATADQKVAAPLRRAA